jgi:hypothetical protein
MAQALTDCGFSVTKRIDAGLSQMEEALISVQKTVENVDGTPSWCFCTEFLEGGLPSSDGERSGGRSKRVDYKDVLSEDDFTVYARLREVRKDTAAAEALVEIFMVAGQQMDCDNNKRFLET